MLRWAALCALVLIGSPARAETILLADGRTLTNASLKAGPTPAQVVIERSGSEPITTTKDEILVVDYNKTSGKPVVPSVRLLTGDQFVGKVSFPGGRQLRLGAGWGTLTVPFAWCAAVRVGEKAELPSPGPQDAVFTTNGDRVAGEIVDVKNDKVQLRINEATVALDLARVKGFTFARSEPPTDAGSGVQVALELGANERLTARWAGLEGQSLKLQPAWGGTLDLPLGAVSRLEVKNGKLVYLSDLKPAEATYVPYLDGDFPHRLNESVGGRPLRLGGTTYRRGIGVHSRSGLRYALDGKFKSFNATLGIDSEVGAHGSVVFRVLGDDKPLFESPIVRGGDEPLDLTLDVSRVQVLRLEVDFADNGDVADHADWADARLLRP